MDCRTFENFSRRIFWIFLNYLWKGSFKFIILFFFFRTSSSFFFQYILSIWNAHFNSVVNFYRVPSSSRDTLWCSTNKHQTRNSLSLFAFCEYMVKIIANTTTEIPSVCIQSAVEKKVLLVSFKNIIKTMSENNSNFAVPLCIVVLKIIRPSFLL